MIHHQTQSEQAPPTSRRALATGSSLLAVMILLSMLPPSAGLVAVTALGDDPVRITMRDPSATTRRETRILPSNARIPVAPAVLAQSAGRTLLAVASADRSPVANRDTDRTSVRDIAPVRDALLALPPPRA